jgi:hypothetical protein
MIEVIDRHNLFGMPQVIVSTRLKLNKVAGQPQCHIGGVCEFDFKALGIATHGMPRHSHFLFVNEVMPAGLQSYLPRHDKG